MAARSNPRTAKSAGTSDKGSRSKAEKAAERTLAQQPVIVPVNEKGKPLAKISFAASELIPTGQYANVAVGPAVIELYIDPDRQIDRDEDGNAMPYFDETQREAIAQAVNEIAELVEVDVIGVQRNLVLESLQGQVSSG